MVVKGLKALYGAELPQRGDIEAFMQGERDEARPALPLPSSNSLPARHPKPALAA